MSKELEMVHVRLIKEASFYSEKTVGSPKDAMEIMAEELSQYDREILCVLNLTTKGRPINMSIVSMGTLNASIISPREVFKCSILSNAASIIIFHNHPSGSPDPSAEDIVVTKRLATCGELLGISLLDHIIIGGGTGKMFSLKEHDLLSSADINKWCNELKPKVKESSDMER